MVRQGYRYSYYVKDETHAYEWRTEPMIEYLAPDSEGVYTITNVTRKARQWRTNPQTPTVSPEPFREATAKFFQQTRKPR